jgi:hypothetical protein
MKLSKRSVEGALMNWQTRENVLERAFAQAYDFDDAHGSPRSKTPPTGLIMIKQQAALTVKNQSLALLT